MRIPLRGEEAKRKRLLGRRWTNISSIINVCNEKISFRGFHVKSSQWQNGFRSNSFSRQLLLFFLQPVEKRLCLPLKFHRFPFLKIKSENLSPLFLKAHSTCLSKDASKEEGDGRRKVRRSGATDLRAPFGIQYQYVKSISLVGPRLKLLVWGTSPLTSIDKLSQAINQSDSLPPDRRKGFKNELKEYQWKAEM